MHLRFSSQEIDDIVAFVGEEEVAGELQGFDQAVLDGDRGANQAAQFYDSGETIEIEARGFDFGKNPWHGSD